MNERTYRFYDNRQGELLRSSSVGALEQHLGSTEELIGAGKAADFVSKRGRLTQRRRTLGLFCGDDRFNFTLRFPDYLLNLCCLPFNAACGSCDAAKRYFPSRNSSPSSGCSLIHLAPNIRRCALPSE